MICQGNLLGYPFPKLLQGDRTRQNSSSESGWVGGLYFTSYGAPGRTAPRLASDYPRLLSDDLRDDVLFCQALVERLGMELLVLDQTRPDIGFPVVKVIVPGLRHFWARFAPGRLYEIPVELGWLPRSLAEHELNPIPMFYLKIAVLAASLIDQLTRGCSRKFACGTSPCESNRHA